MENGQKSCFRALQARCIANSDSKLSVLFRLLRYLRGLISSAALLDELVVVLVANPVTAALLPPLCQILREKTACFIFVPNRCEEPKLSIGQLHTVRPYSPIVACHVIIKCLFVRRFHVMVPHDRLGQFADCMIQLSDQVSLLDDGLDTLRDRPKNISNSLLSKAERFYVHDHSSAVGSWVSTLEVERIGSLKSLANNGRPYFDFNAYDRVIIESPPMNVDIVQPMVSKDDAILVRHSNPSKRLKGIEPFVAIEGGVWNLEASLSTYKGVVYVGESLIVSYLLALSPRPCRVVVITDLSMFERVPILLEQVRAADNAALFLAG